MKKLIAMLLCFAMIAAFGATAAFAAMPDPSSAAYHVGWSRYWKGSVKDQAEWTETLGKVEAILKEYEAVKYDSSKTAEQVKAAHDKAVDKLKAIDIDNDPDSLTSTQVATFKASSKVWEATYALYADRNDVWTKYWLSSGTKMDSNARVIGIAKLEAAYDLAQAQTAVANAKAGAVKAQATAKVLIADSIKVAQDAAATAVANAQAAAYNTLAANYADAVEAFWGEVAAAWGF
nr:hypothetical protein [Clostridia bacterium]